MKSNPVPDYMEILYSILILSAIPALVLMFLPSPDSDETPVSRFLHYQKPWTSWLIGISIIMYPLGNTMTFLPGTLFQLFIIVFLVLQIIDSASESKVIDCKLTKCTVHKGGRATRFDLETDKRNFSFTSNHPDYLKFVKILNRGNDDIPYYERKVVFNKNKRLNIYVSGIFHRFRFIKHP